MKQLAGDKLFERDTSRYVVEGRRVVSVTEALNVCGLVDFSGVPVTMLEAAQRRGTMAHGIIELINADDDSWQGLIDETTEPYIDAYFRFMDETKFTPLLTEHLVVSRVHRFAGRLDVIGILNGRIVLIDYKTAAAIARHVGLQLAGYKLGLSDEVVAELADVIGETGTDQMQMLRLKLPRFALRLGRDGRYTLVEFTRHRDTGDFLAAVRVANWQLTHGDWALEG